MFSSLKSFEDTILFVACAPKNISLACLYSSSKSFKYFALCGFETSKDCRVLWNLAISSSSLKISSEDIIVPLKLESKVVWLKSLSPCLLALKVFILSAISDASLLTPLIASSVSSRAFVTSALLLICVSLFSKVSSLAICFINLVFLAFKALFWLSRIF